MSNLTEQDYAGFNAVTAELIDTLDVRKKYHADHGYGSPESLDKLDSVLTDVYVYRTDIVPDLAEQTKREREAGKAVHDAFYDSLDGVHSPFDSKIEFMQNAWIAAAKALNG